jgi:hypothetical protein
MRRITMMDNAPVEKMCETPQRASQRSDIRLLSLRAGLGLIALAVAVLSVVRVGDSLAEDQPLPAVTVNYQTGEITAIYEKTLDIDRRNFGLTPDVVMLDDHGRVLDPGRLVVTAEVKFHVKKEQSNMIDKMIVTLPR